MDSKEYINKRLSSDEEFRKEYFKRNLRFEVSQLVTEARIYKGLSQAALAEIMGTQQPSIARIESGKTLPSLSFLERMAIALKTYLIPPRFPFMDEVSHSPITTSSGVHREGISVHLAPQIIAASGFKNSGTNSSEIISPYQLQEIGYTW